MKLLILILSIILLEVLYFFISYLIAKKKYDFKNKDFSKIIEIMINNTLSSSIKTKECWLWMLNIGIGVQIVRPIADKVLDCFVSHLNITINDFTEIIFLIICSVILFGIASIIGSIIVILGIRCIKSKSNNS